MKDFLHSCVFGYYWSQCCGFGSCWFLPELEKRTSQGPGVTYSRHRNPHLITNCYWEFVPTYGRKQKTSPSNQATDRKPTTAKLHNQIYRNEHFVQQVHVAYTWKVFDLRSVLTFWSNLQFSTLHISYHVCMWKMKRELS